MDLRSPGIFRGAKKNFLVKHECFSINEKYLWFTYSVLYSSIDLLEYGQTLQRCQELSRFHALGMHITQSPHS